MTTGTREFRMGLLALAAATACGSAGKQAEIACAEACPDGTRAAAFTSSNYEEALGLGATLVQGEECEAFCMPVIPCLAPNVPVVDANSFDCVPLDGFAEVPDVTSIDLSFGDLWDASQAQP